MPAKNSSGKPSRFFIDTNVFVYTFAEESPLRRAKARELVELALTTGMGVVSFQVVQEFLNVATRKFAVPLSAADSRAYLEQVFAPLWRVSPTASLYAQAVDIQETSGYGFYDSLIVASALSSACDVLYSQDLQHGRCFGSLTIIDPFL